MKRIVKTLCTLVLLVPVALAAQETPSAVQAPDVDEIFAAYLPSTPGCQLGVLRKNEFVYKKAYGMADLEHRVPMRTASPIITGSLAKQFTAAVVAILAKQEKLSIEDSIRKYIPELPPYLDAVTISMLVHHTSGKLGFKCKHSVFDAGAEGSGHFRFSNYSIQFETGADGKVTAFTLNALRVKNLRFEKRPAK